MDFKFVLISYCNIVNTKMNNIKYRFIENWVAAKINYE